MNSRPNQNFYQNNQLATLVSNETNKTLFRGDTRILAEITNEKSNLLATDVNDSIIATPGNPTCNINYTPYGHSLALTERPLTLGFNGEAFISLANAYLLGNGYRLYNNMRFNSPDSLSPFDAGGRNAYCYCLGDPINHVDPSGHMPVLGRLMRRQQFAKALHHHKPSSPSFIESAPPLYDPSRALHSSIEQPPAYQPPPYSLKLPKGHSRLITPPAAMTEDESKLSALVTTTRPPAYPLPKETPSVSTGAPPPSRREQRIAELEQSLRVAQNNISYMRRSGGVPAGMISTRDNISSQINRLRQS
ncbi:RHS repeat-associated protein [Pseudomonas hunanensis]|uniref:RHS repeat-associated protein n=1 Tax=Pseudomonas hunanensis TaxID=1247546 RepID=A0ACC6K1H6_9PSED|nr:RHS repeat-associated core domain-containing protein [Pseudomonas hunanensis]MDR6712231.1 RHS repeat-associated protein [Pseudomonas hunanensis]